MSQTAISSWASGMEGSSTHWKTSAGAPSLSMTARMISTVSYVVRLVRGCGEKITASFALIALMAVPGGVRAGFVMGTIEAMTPAGLAYLTIPFSGSSSMTPTLG